MGTDFTGPDTDTGTVGTVTPDTGTSDTGTVTGGMVSVDGAPLTIESVAAAAAAVPPIGVLTLAPAPAPAPTLPAVLPPAVLLSVLLAP